MFIHSDYTNGEESDSNRDLWIAFSTGNKKALSKLFLRFYERLFRYGMNFYPCEERAKDSIQILFLRLWKKRKTMEVPDSIDSYLFVSLRRILLRNNEKETAMVERHHEFSQRTLSSVLNIEEEIISREEKEQQKKFLHNALQSLTERQKEVLLLRLDSGLSNEEIAYVMGISGKRVRNLFYEATKRAKAHISKSSS